MQKKIKNIAQLKSEKVRLHQSINELEREIKDNWTELKQTLRPGKSYWNIFNAQTNDERNEKLHGDDFLKSSIRKGVDRVLGRVVDSAGRQLFKIFKRK